MRISSQIPMPDRPLAARLELRLLQASMVFPAFPPLPLARLPRRTAPRSRFRAGQAGGVLNRFGAYGERRDIAVGQTGDRQRISGRMRRKSKSGPGLRRISGSQPPKRLRTQAAEREPPPPAPRGNVTVPGRL
jgi:hypothetical protein